MSRDGGTLSLPARAADLWATGARYVLRFAPRLNPATLGAALEQTCLFQSGQPAVTLPFPRLHIGVILGELTITQRARTYSLSHQPAASPACERRADRQPLGADVSPVSLNPVVHLASRSTGVHQATLPATIRSSHAVGPDGRVWGQLR